MPYSSTDTFHSQKKGKKKETSVSLLPDPLGIKGRFLKGAAAPWYVFMFQMKEHTVRWVPSGFLSSLCTLPALPWDLN